MNIGIIGGADGPTTIFLSSSSNWCINVIITVAFVVIGISIWKVRKKKNKQ